MTEADAAQPVERDEYTAKQIATRIGADPKVLRKFFRSSASSVEPVGQGGRYVFDAADLPKIKAEFTKWNEGKKPRATKSDTPKATRSTPPRHAEAVEDADEILELEDEDEEPTLDDLDDIELDDEELDDEELDDIDEDEDDDR